MILHGLYGSKQNWRSLARGLAQKTQREVHALVSRDARGEGVGSEGSRRSQLTGCVVHS